MHDAILCNDNWVTVNFGIVSLCRCWESNTYDVNITSDISTADFTFTNSIDVIQFLERLILYIIIIALPFMIAYYDRYFYQYRHIIVDTYYNALSLLRMFMLRDGLSGGPIRQIYIVSMGIILFLTYMRSHVF